MGYDAPVVSMRRAASCIQETDMETIVSHDNIAAQRFEAPMKKAARCYAKHEANKLESLKTPNLAQKVLDPTAQSGERVTGRMRYARARHALSSFGLNPSPMQKLFFNNMFGACAKLILRDDFDTERDDFMLELGLTRMQPQFMAITPRRFGKTYSVAMFVVAMAYAIEGIEQAIFSTGRRASSKLRDLIYAFICRIPGMKESIGDRNNSETIWINGSSDPTDVRKISAYPSKVKVRKVVISLRRPPHRNSKIAKR